MCSHRLRPWLRERARVCPDAVDWTTFSDYPCAVVTTPVFFPRRAKTDRESTSRLSPYIHFGEISVRRIYFSTKEKEASMLASGESVSDSVSSFLQQMAYREYSRYISFHFPFTHQRSLLEHLVGGPRRAFVLLAPAFEP